MKILEKLHQIEMLVNDMVSLDTTIEINELFSLGTVIGLWGKLKQAVALGA